MKRLLKVSALAVIGGALSFAGVITAAVHVVRHPVKTAGAVVKVATYPVRHPVKTLR